MGDGEAPTTAFAGALRAAAESGDPAPLLELYAPDAVLRVYAPGRRTTSSRPKDIAIQLQGLVARGGTIAEFSAESFDGGENVTVERHRRTATALDADRYVHDIHLDAGRITAHMVMSDRPRLVPLADDPRFEPVDLPGIVERHPMSEAGAFSGDGLERLVMADGSTRVVKYAVDNWISRATGADQPREVELWRSGVFDALRPSIDVPFLGVLPAGNAQAIVMRDVSEHLSEHRGSTPRDDVRRLLAAVVQMYRVFRGRPVEGLSSLANRLTVFSEANAERELNEPDLATKQDLRVWEVFPEVAPADIADVILGLRDDPKPLTDELEKCTCTLLHGDLKPSNFGVTDTGVVLIDWQLATWGPPAIDFIWMLNFMPWLGASFEQLHDDFRATMGPDYDERSYQLAVIFHMTMAASGLATDLVDNPDPEARAGAREEFEWWVAATRRALETTWSPS